MEGILFSVLSNVFVGAEGEVVDGSASGPSQRSWPNPDISHARSLNQAGRTLEFGTLRLYQGFGYGLFLQ